MIHNYKISLTVLLLLFSFKHCFAQQVEKEKDSLLKIISNADKARAYDALIHLSQIYDFENFDSSLHYAFSALNYAKDIKDSSSVILAHRSIGVSYNVGGFYDQALSHYDTALFLLEKINSIQNKDFEKAHLMHNIGMIKQELRDYTEAKKFLHNSLSYYRNLEDSLELITSFYAIGSLCWEIGEYDSSLLYLNSAFKLTKQTSNYTDDGLVLILAEIIQVYIMKGEIEKARSLIEQTELLYPDENLSFYSKGYLFFDKALIYGIEKKYQKAFSAFDSALWYSDQIGLAEEGINIFIEYVRVAEKSGDFEKAFFVQNELLNREREWFDDKKVSYTKAKETELGTREKEQKLVEQKEELSRKELIILWISVLSASVLMFSFILFRNNKVIRNKNERIEALIRELHHRVKNNLQVISSLLSLQSMRLDEGEVKEAVEEGRSRIKAMAMIHQNLYLQEDTAEIDAEKYLRELLLNLSESYGVDQGALSMNINKLKLDIDTILPVGLIVNELVSNSFKYAFPETEKPKLEVNFENIGKELRLIIKDNGKGLDAQKNNENSTAFGMSLVNLLVKQLHGTMEVNSLKGLEYNLRFSYKSLSA
ncbi:tetratricopeptide repeat protein [Hyphobacterium sp. CCMP332]|nr:tetratricopeptide repeat protein [Hyphobacterium sp. CCMP332]